MCVVASAVAGPVAGAVAGAGVSSALAPSTSAAANAADPFASQRAQYQQQLSALMANPSSVTSTPGYQFNLTQGLNSTEGAMAAGGYLNSGNVLTALDQYGANYASNQYQNQVATLAGLAGANVGSPSAAGQIINSGNTTAAVGASAIGNQVGNAVSSGINSLTSSSYSAGSNPFATDTSGYSAGANTYGFSSGVSDASYGVSY